MKEKIEEEVLQNEKDEHLEILIEGHKALEDKGSFTKKENEFREKVKMYLYDEKKKDDCEIAEMLGLEEATIAHWRYRRGLPKLGSSEMKKCHQNHKYEVTERELALVRSFVLKYIARRQAKGDNFTYEEVKGIVQNSV